MPDDLCRNAIAPYIVTDKIDIPDSGNTSGKTGGAVLTDALRKKRGGMPAPVDSGVEHLDIMSEVPLEFSFALL